VKTLPLLAVALGFALLSPSMLVAEDVTVEVEIKSIDPTSRTITVVHGGKTTQLDFSRKVAVTIKGSPGEIGSILPGDSATVVYHKELEVVTKIDAEGKGANGWRFWDIYKKNVDPKAAFVAANDGSLVCLPNVAGYCLASLTKMSEFTLKIDFQFSGQVTKGNPFVAVASSVPNPKANDWKQQMPKGIEIKLRPDQIGELSLPKDFKVELPLGQLRDDRRVVRLREPRLQSNDWNQLEIVCDQHRNLTIKVNGTTVNAVAKAESLDGHIILFPSGVAVRFRNPIVVTDGTESPMAFDNIVTE
jgi:hypothetical protein